MMVVSVAQNARRRCVVIGIASTAVRSGAVVSVRPLDAFVIAAKLVVRATAAALR